MKDVNEEELAEWIGTYLYPEDLSVGQFFESTISLYSAQIERPFIETLIHKNAQVPKFNVSAGELSQIILESCQELKIIPGAYWFQVNFPDNALRIVEAVGLYSYQQNMFPLYHRMEYFPADQGGLTVVGLLGKRRDWMFSVELGNQLVIAIHGSKLFCEQVNEKVRKTALLCRS